MSFFVFVILPLLSVFTAIWAVLVAHGRGRSTLLWGALGFFFSIFAIIALYVLPRLAVPEEPASVEFGGGYGDLPKPHPDQVFAMLSEYDPAVRAAVTELAPLGEDAIRRLREAHMTIRDPALLPEIVLRVREQLSQARVAPRRAPQGDAMAPSEGAASGPALAGGNGGRALRPDRRGAPSFDSPVDMPGELRAGTNGKPTQMRAAPQRQPPSYATIEAPLDMPVELGAPKRAVNAQQRQQPSRMPQRERPSDLERREVALPNGASRDRRPAAVQEMSQPLSSASDDVVELKSTRSAARSAAVAPPTEKPQVDTSIGPNDLDGASHLETYKNVHLFQLADGRVYVDQYAAVSSVQAARRIVDQGLPGAA